MATYTVGPSGTTPDYTATGTNDQNPINSALATAKTVPGSTVYLRGPFTYDIQSSLQIGNSTILTGDSTAKLRLHDHVTWANQVHIIKQSESIASNITIHGFEIDCNRDNQDYDEGDGYHNAIGLRGNSNSPGINVSVHDMYIHHSLGDGVRLQFINNITSYNNDIQHMGHECNFLIQCVGADIYNNSFLQRCNSSVRLDNCQNVNIHHNTCNGSMINGNSHIQIGNEPASYGLTKLTQNINIYENTLADSPASGIMFMDAWGSAGTTAQTVKVWNNTISNCGWKANYVNYNAGISIWNWGNGLNIFNNTINGAYNAGVLVLNAISSGCTANIYNNNILNTKNTLSTDSAKRLAVTGYGFLNTQPSKLAIYAENNYLTGSATGNYYQVVPISEATSLIGEYGEGDTVTPTTRYIPPIRIIQEELTDYYDLTEPRQGYINGVKFYWQEKSVDGGKSVGQKKAPGIDGDNLTDFGFKGTGLVLDCYAFSLDELNEVLAAWYDISRGRSKLELGGPYAGTVCRGLTVDHSSKLRLTEDVPENAHPYSILYQMDKPHKESASQKVRGRFVTGSMQWSADDTYAGNLLKNHSFESWSKSTEMTFETETSPYDNEYRCVRWSRELSQFCAVSAGASDTTGTHIITSSNGDSWAVPAGLTNAANYDNKWRGLAWGSCRGLNSGEPLPGRWVATGISGTARSIYSDDGITWNQGGATPANSWGSCVYVRDDDEEVYRYVAVAYGSGETNRVMYSDDGAASWTAVASANEGCFWISVCYSESLKRLVAVAFSGTSGQQAMYSDDYGATWTIATTPTTNQEWTNVIWAEQLGLFVACSQSNVSQQIMTSPDGETWTLQNTPVCGSTVIPGTGTEVSTNTYQTPTGWNYSTQNTDWHTGALTDANSGGILSIEALTNGHKWRLDRIFCKLRSGGTCCDAWIKITAQTATKAETTLAEWYTNSTTYIPYSQDVIFESANNEAITLTVYMKTENASIKAIATDFGYVLTEYDGTGGSTIEYSYNQWRSMTWSPDNAVLVCVAQSGTGNRAMMSTTAENWVLVDTPADNNWLSICYSDLLNKFVSVAGSGTGNRIMSCDTYGGVTTPANWILEGPGVSRSDTTAHDGLYSLKISGNGATEDIGIVKQYALFEPGVSYVVSAWGKVEGLTHGKFAVDIYSGNSIIAQMLWDEDTDYIQLQTTVRFDTAPTDAFIRVHGIDTVNAGAIFYCDDVLLERSSDFEIGTTGQSIVTSGHVDIVPDVEVRAITSSSSSNVAKGKTETFTDPNIHSAIYTSYHNDLTITLPALSDGKYYRFDRFSCGLATANVSGTTGYLKVTIQAASINNGAETTVVIWSSTSRIPTYTAKSINTELFSATNEQVVLRWYLMTNKANVKVYADDISYTFTEMIPSVVSSAISIYNTADTLTRMECCNELKPGCSIAINNDGTGWYKYSENFADGQYAFAVTDASGITYDNTEKMLIFSSTGYITFKFDTKYPVTGVPYIVLSVIQGAPLIYIAADNNGSPGSWNALDGNDTTDLSETQAYRLLNSGTTLILNGLTKFHLKIASGGSVDLQINSVFMFAELVTIDAERPKIFKGQQNTFGAVVTSTASAIVTLKYRDADILS
jgi:hypothetical protein